MSRLFLIILAVISCGIISANAQDDVDVDRELDQLQGTWELVSAHRSGKDATSQMPKDYKIIFRSDRLIFEIGGRELFEDGHCHIVLHPSKSPKQFELLQTIKFATGAREFFSRATLPGIYEFDGETLRLCWDVEGKNRPSNFVTKVGSEHVSVSLKRTGKAKITSTSNSKVKTTDPPANEITPIDNQWGERKDGLQWQIVCPVKKASLARPTLNVMVWIRNPTDRAVTLHSVAPALSLHDNVQLIDQDGRTIFKFECLKKHVMVPLTLQPSQLRGFYCDVLKPSCSHIAENALPGTYQLKVFGSNSVEIEITQ